MTDDTTGTETAGEACTCPPDEFLSPSDCALHGDRLPNQFAHPDRYSNGEETDIPANLADLLAKYEDRAANESARYCRASDVVADLRAALVAAPTEAFTTLFEQIEDGMGGAGVLTLEQVDQLARYLTACGYALPTEARGLGERLSAYLDKAEAGMDQWGTCGHEWLSLKELRALLAETAAPETEGFGPLDFEWQHSAAMAPIQPAAEGARENDGLAKERLLRAIFEKQTPEDIRAEAEQMCEEDPPCEVCMQIANYSVGAHSDWLAEDRRRARAEGGAGAAAYIRGFCLHARHRTESDGRGHFAPILCGICSTLAEDIETGRTTWLRDRAAGLRETR